MLSQIFKSVLLLSIVGGSLSLILFALKPVTKRVFGSRWQYYIWLAVLIVMMLPITIKLPVKTTTALEQTPPAQIPQKNNVQQIQQLDNIPDNVITPNIPVQRTIMDTLNRMTLGVYNLIIYIWLSGALIFFIGGLINYWLFLRTIRKNSIRISCSELYDVLREKCMKNKIHVRSTNCINAPLMVGIFRPTLVIPETEMSESELRYILLHELTRLKRCDLLYKWFAMLVNAVHWFNPLVYFVVRQINEECEISCDLTVTQNMTNQEKNGYMNTILTLLSENKSKKQMLTTAIASDTKQIKRRFTMIRKFKKLNKFTAFTSIITAILILVATVFASGVLANGLFTDNSKIKIYKDDSPIRYKNQPFIEDEVIYIPLRETLNLCGVTNEDIAWRDGVITIVALPTKAEIYIDYDDCYINGMVVSLTGKTLLKDDTSYISADFINVLEISQSDLTGKQISYNIDIFYDDINVIEEYAKSNISPDDILLNADNLDPIIAMAYKTKIFLLFKLNSSYNEYFLYDIDNDGVMELFVGWREKRVYTYQNNAVQKLGNIYNDEYKIEGESGFYTYGGFGTGLVGTTYYEIQNGVLVSKEGRVNLQYTYFGDGVTYKYNGETINKDDYNKLVDDNFNEANMPVSEKNHVN